MEQYILNIPKSIEKIIEKKLDKTLLTRLNEKMQKLKFAPDVYGKPLRGPLAGIWEIRFEKRWRVLYTIDYEKKIIIVRGFKHKDEMTK